MRLLESLPAEAQQRRLVAPHHCLRFTLPFKDQLDRHQVSGATANHAAEKAELGQIDKLGREVVGIPYWDQVDGNGTFGIRPVKQTTGKLP